MPAEVAVWDPDGRRKRYARADWSKRWQGIALVAGTATTGQGE